MAKPVTGFLRRVFGRDGAPKARSSEPALCRQNGAKVKACSEIVVCEFAESVLQAVHVRRSNGNVSANSANRAVLSDSKETAAFLGRRRKRCPVIALLPKSLYLVKVVEIPAVRPDEVASIVRLETEGGLPPEFGPAEISYSELPPGKEGFRRYEVYVSRSESVGSFLSSLEALDCDVDLILPSAVAWRGAFVLHERINMLVLPTSKSLRRAEIALSKEDGSLSVRTVEVSDGDDEFSAIMQSVTECARSLLFTTVVESPGVVVGWVGQGCPTEVDSDVVVFEDVNEKLRLRCEGESAGELDNPSLLVAALSLLSPVRENKVETCNLLPRGVLNTRATRALYRTLAVGAAAAVLGMVLVYAALRIAAARYESAYSDLLSRTSRIETKGEAVGLRVRQLAAIRDARSTRNDFRDIISGLYEGTPSGVTYSSVQLGENGVIRLRGQAESLALPFLLPQELEKQPRFEKVVLRDAGQVKKSGGTITEFRMQCRLGRRK